MSHIHILHMCISYEMHCAYTWHVLHLRTLETYGEFGTYTYIYVSYNTYIHVLYIWTYVYICICIYIYVILYIWVRDSLKQRLLRSLCSIYIHVYTYEYIYIQVHVHGYLRNSYILYIHINIYVYLRRVRVSSRKRSSHCASCLHAKCMRRARMSHVRNRCFDSCVVMLLLQYWGHVKIHRNKLQRTATAMPLLGCQEHVDTAHVDTHRSTLQHTATHYHTLQHIATHCTFARPTRMVCAHNETHKIIPWV